MLCSKNNLKIQTPVVYDINTSSNLVYGSEMWLNSISCKINASSIYEKKQF